MAKTYTIKLDDKAAFLNRLKKQNIFVNSDSIQDNTLNKTFALTLHDPTQIQVADQLLQQSKDIDDNPSTKLPPLKNNHPRLEELRNLIKKELEEIKIIPNHGSQVNFNGRIINKSTHEEARITKYGWDEAVSNKILSSTTLKNVTKVFIDTLGITPDKVYVERGGKSSGPSFFIKANYHGEPLLFSRRQTEHPTAGQTILMSKYIRIITTHRILQACESKENLLKALRIPEDK